MYTLFQTAGVCFVMGRFYVFSAGQVFGEVNRRYDSGDKNHQGRGDSERPWADPQILSKGPLGPTPVENKVGKDEKEE